MLINFFKCYKQLVNQKILEKKELELVYKWIMIFLNFILITKKYKLLLINDI